MIPPFNYQKHVNRMNFKLNGGWQKVFWTLMFRGVGWILVGLCVGVGMRLIG